MNYNKLFKYVYLKDSKLVITFLSLIESFIFKNLIDSFIIIILKYLKRI